MRRELHIFLTAIMFYTRIPCPKWVDHNPDYINLSTRYFPLIGWIVGGIYGVTIGLLTFIFPPLICILLGVGASILLTGAFHEDGFADVCDGFGGGWTKEKILMIMKDSRLGTYGVVGVILILSLKISVTFYLIPEFETPGLLILFIITSHSLSRMMAVFVIYLQPYARDDESSKVKPVAMGISRVSLVIALMFGVIPFFVLLFETKLLLSLAMLPMIIMTFYLMHYFKKWIGGYTGDCLGAIQQVNEIIFLLTSLALWRFM